MSDEEEEWMSSEDDGDFSASEDEWLPGSTGKKRKGRNDTMDSESDVSEEDEEDLETPDEASDSDTPIKMTRKQAAKRGVPSKVSKKKSPAGVRKLFTKYKHVPEATTSSASTSTSLSDILKRSEFQSKKLNSSQTESKTLEDDDESSSSGDEHLVPADQINLNSDFFNVQSSTSRKSQNEEPPEFDCNFGISKSDESEEERESETEFHGFSNDSIERSASKLKSKNKKKPQEKSKMVDLQELHNFNKNLEDAKKKLEGYQSKNFAQEEIDVSKLLAMGEESAEKPKKSKETKSNKRKHEESGSDWEEVEDELDDEPSSIETQGKDLQITVELPGGHSRKRTAKEVDIEAQIKRKLNNIKKINQVYMHKVHLLCWIAYGNRVNQVLNSPGLYKVALKTLPVPAKPCYPKDKTDIKYFENISTWFRQQYSLTCQSVYPKMTTLPPLETSLTLQISNGKKMICKRDFCMAFIVLLRAMGFQARLVMSITGIPLKPPQSELCSLSKSKTFKGYKKPEEDNIKSPSKKTTLEELKKGRKKPEIKEDPKPERKRKATDDPKKSKKKLPKLDQLDGANDTPPPKTRKKPSTSTNHIPSVDSPFKKKIKGNTNGSPSIKLDNFAPPMKPKIKRLSEVPTFDVAPSPLKTRRQRQKEGSAPKMPVKSKVTETTSLPISNSQPGTSSKISPSILKTQPSTKSNSSSRKSVSFESPKPSTSKKSPKKSSGPRGHQNKKQKIIIPSSDDEDLFEPDIVFEKPLVNKHHEKVKKIDRRVLSSDEETPKKPGIKKNHVNVWVEVYAEKEKRWITVDLFKGKVDCVDVICQNATSPITYVLAWNNDNSLKDVSPRYCEHWNTVTRKLRVEKEWWDETIQPFLSKHVTERDKAENKYFEKIHSTKPMPTAISDFKNHPLYALERHLLKFEALYPPDAPPIGWIRKEPVYPRDCVYTLLTREKWVKEARVVKLNEEPYKIVTSPKWDKYAQKILKNCPVELFGIWQTAPYEPPTAENGIVPRNEYGNVELFKECMLPKKTVHLKFAGLNKVCKKLQVDCAPAIVGFDFHNGWSHPVYDGFVVCEEFEELVTNAWIEEQDEMMKKEREKIEKRVYGNWRKLIKGLLIKKRLQARYNFEGDDEDVEEEEEEKPVKSVVKSFKKGKK